MLKFMGEFVKVNYIWKVSKKDVILIKQRKNNHVFNLKKC